MNGKFGLSLGVVAAAAAIGGLLYLAFAPVEEAAFESRAPREGSKKAERSTMRKKLPGAAKTAKTTPKAEKANALRARPPKRPMPQDWFAKLPAPDRAVAKRIQDAQDADDQAAVLKAAEEALDSKNADVRSAAVEALSLQNEKAATMPLLIKFVTDGNKDVADAAYRAWDDAVDGIDGDLDKLGAVKQLLSVAKEQEHVKSAVGKIEAFDQARAIRELAKIARGDSAAAEAAKESYENVTGEPFESWAAAELKAIAIDRDNAGDSAD